MGRHVVVVAGGAATRFALALALVSAAGCGGAGGASGGTTAESAGGEESASAGASANQQGSASADPSATAGAGGSESAGTRAPTQADVLGRGGYGGAGYGVGGGAGGQGLIGADREHPVPTCGPEESYLYVARDFVCPGGGNPLGGDPSAGAAARDGNVGPHHYTGPRSGDPMLDAHIVDLYTVPCPSGPVQVYVCMYHCAPGRGPM